MEAVEKEAASESEEDSDTEEAMRFVSQVEAMLHATHIDLNSEGMDYDMICVCSSSDGRRSGGCGGGGPDGCGLLGRVIAK